MIRFLFACFAFLSLSVSAKVPTNQAPSKGSSDNILTLLLYYAYDGMLYGGGMFIAAIFMYFMYHLWDLYSKIKEKQATKKDLLTDAMIGIVLLFLSIWGWNYSLDLLDGI